MIGAYCSDAGCAVISDAQPVVAPDMRQPAGELQRLGCTTMECTVCSDRAPACGVPHMNRFFVRALSAGCLGVALYVTAFLAHGQTAAREALNARAKSLELDTQYVPPPGDAMEHYASGYAKIMCSSVFITGLDPAFAAENVGYFTAPYAERAKLGTPKIDREKRIVEVTMPNGTVRTAKQVGRQGCVTLPIGTIEPFCK